MVGKRTERPLRVADRADVEHPVEARQVVLEGAHGCELDEELFQLRRRGEIVKVEPRSFDLLLYLAHRSGQTVSRDALYKDVRGIEYDGLDRSIDLRIARLRRKLGDDAKHPALIKSVRGEGYLLAPGGG